jgi:chromosome segregation ATPase
MRLSDLEEEAYGPEDYDEIKAKKDKERNDKKKKADRVTRERDQVAKAQNELRTQRQQAARAAGSR